MVARSDVPRDVRQYVEGPGEYGNYYKTCNVNGHHFHSCAAHMLAQATCNSCMVSPSYMDRISRKSDPNIQRVKLQYYGILQHIVEVEISPQHKEVLFKGTWFETTISAHNLATHKEDECLFLKIKINAFHGTREPWVSAKTVTQVVYVEEWLMLKVVALRRSPIILK